MTGLTASLSTTYDGVPKLLQGIKNLRGDRVLIGIPDATAAHYVKPSKADRRKMKKLSAETRKRASVRRARLNNAQLLFLMSNGSPLRGYLPAPVIEPALLFPPNRKLITETLGNAMAAELDGDMAAVVQLLGEAGMLGRNASIRWFTNPENHWPKNAESTIRAKGSDRRNIDTGQMRRAITYVLLERSS